MTTPTETACPIPHHVCGCGRAFSVCEWLALPICARPGQSQKDARATWEALGLDGRNCPDCNSTLALEVSDAVA